MTAAALGQINHEEIAQYLDPDQRYVLSPTPIESFHPVKQPTRGDYKPWGLWYACGPTWLTHTLSYRDNNAGWWDRHAQSWQYLYEVDVNLDAMKVLRSNAALARFSEVWIPQGFGFFGRNAPDWYKLAKRYAGIEICPHLSLSREKYSWYSGWDVASGCIWDSNALKSLSLLAEMTSEGWVWA